MLDVNYPPKMIEKANYIARYAKTLGGHLVRTEFTENFCGLTYQYLRRIGTDYKQPSNRTIMNLGYELYAKDLATGEFILLEMNIKCNWNPKNPIMNPVCSSLSVEELVIPSTTSE